MVRDFAISGVVSSDELIALARLAAIVETSEDAIISKTLNGTVLTWNEGAERIYGYSAEEMIGRSISLIVPPERTDELRNIMGKLEQGEHTRHFETVRMTKSGRKRNISLTISPVHDDDGRVIGAAAIERDITDRKRMESEHDRQERILRDVLEHAPVGILWLTQDGRIIWANQAFLDLVQCARGDHIGCFAGEFYQDSGRAADLLYRLRSGETVHNVEARFRCSDGSTRDVLVSANAMLDDDEFVLSRCFVIDITRRKQMEQWLRESEARFRAMADDAPVLIWMTDPHKKFTFFNARWLEFRGTTMDEETGDGWTKGVHPLDYERCVSTYEAAFTARNRFEMEYRLRRYDGQFRWVLDTGTPRFTPDGTFAGYIGSCVDITDHKEVEALLEERTRRQSSLIKREAKRRRRAEGRAHEQLSQLAHFARVATMGEMASGLAHELNQPLCAIVNYTEASLSLLDARGINGDVRNHLAHVAEQAERAGEVIRRLREFIRRRVPVAKHENLNDLVREVLELAKCDVTNHHTEARLELLEDAPSVLVDKIQIQQVILNLMRNGLDAMSATPKQDRKLDLVIRRHGERLLSVSVTDSGCGLTKDESENVFEPFFSTKSNGMGMGLSISRSIVEEHDGSLWATPNPEGGSTFIFTVPIAIGKQHDSPITDRFRRR